MADPSAITLESLRAVYEDLRAKDPRTFEEMRLLSALKRLNIDAIMALTNLANKGLFDGLNEPIIRPTKPPGGWPIV